MSKRLTTLTAAALLAVPTLAGASVLTFEDLHLYHYGDIPNTYGDSLPGTPNVTVDWYERLISDHSVVNDHLDFWTDRYGDLYEVAYAPTDPDTTGIATYAEIVLVPQPGYAVRLLSFDIAGYPYEDQTGQPVLVNGLNINPSGVIHGGPGEHSAFAPYMLSFGPLAINFGFFNWDVAIDNIAFEQCEVGETGCIRPPLVDDAVPEPAAVALLGAGLIGLLVRARARRR